MAKEELQQSYANAFGGQGRKVLGDILGRLGHFGLTLDPNDPVMVAEYNMAVTIARMAGVFDPIYPQLGIDIKEE